MLSSLDSNQVRTSSDHLYACHSNIRPAVPFPNQRLQDFAGPHRSIGEKRRRQTVRVFGRALQVDAATHIRGRANAVVAIYPHLA